MEKNELQFNSHKYWMKELMKAEESEKLKHDYYSDISYKKEIYNISIDRDCGIKLSEMCKKNSFLIYSFLVSALKVNLSKYMFKKYITVGIPYFNPKNKRKLANSKVLPLSSYVDYEKTYKEYMKSIKEQILNVYKNQDFLNTSILSDSNVCKDIMEITAINICMKNLHEDKYINYICNSSKNEISFLLELLKDNTIKAQVIYNSNLFSESTIANISRCFRKTLDDILNDHNQSIKDIKILSEEERSQILYEFNDTEIDYPKNRTIQEVFEAQVEKQPDNIAVVFEGTQLTYTQINKKSNQIARILRKNKIGPGCIVGIMVERSPEMIIGILGILKAGGAYLPIDPSYPKERIEYMLKDSESNLLLSTENLSGSLNFNGKIIDLYNEDLFKGDSSNLEQINNFSDLAYVIYTSGTTGKPKGVMIEHKSAINTLDQMQRKYPVENNDVYLLKTNYVFDVSVTELFGWFFGNGVLAIMNENDQKDINSIIDSIEKYKVTHINFVPSILNLFNEMIGNRMDKVKSLKYVFAAGEELKANIIFDFYNKFTEIQLENLYGPTEASIYATMYSVDKRFKGDNVSIGTPIQNTKIYIMNNNQLNPVGVAGELCIGGEGVARGYLNRPELTAKKFVDNPFESGKKMYKTGDLARWLPDGNIEFLGRIDNQVKIRGFRIELGEIENRLLQHEDLKEAAVVVKENKEKEKYISAYVVSDKEISELNLRDYLKENLPDYMIPAYFVQLEKMPITTNGKLDRRALPEPDLEIILSEYEAPRNKVEEALSKIWSEVLGVDRIGINDNFFNLGGHSLKATILSNKIHQEFEMEIPLREIFEAPTIKGISEYIENGEKSIYSSIDSTEEKDYYEVSSAQKRMYLQYKFNTESTGYNMPCAIEIEGKLVKEKVQKAINELIKRHESLRTSFEVIDGQIVQKINKDIDFNIDFIEYTTETNINEAINNFVRPFDLSNSTLLRMGLMKIQEDKHIIIFDIHHIISDGVSSGILIKEFIQLYKGEILSPLRVQYKDYAQWQNEFFKSEKYNTQKEYWENVFQGETPILNINTDYQRPAIQSFEGDRFEFEIDEELSWTLKMLAKETDSTLYMVLLAVYNILLNKYTGQQDIVIGSPIAGRRHAELQNILGMFVNMLSIRSYPSGKKSFMQLLDEIKENTLKAYDNQDYQYEDLVEALNLSKDMSRNPLFDVVFSLSNFDEETIELDDLKFTNIKMENKISKFDLTLDAYEKENRIVFSFEYATDLFKKQTIQRLSNYYVNILRQITKNPLINILDIEIFTEEEKKKILFDFNDTRMDYDREKTIHELFMEQVEKTPDEIAIVYEHKSITYKELNEKTNQLAELLREHDVRRDEIIGIMAERSIDMIIGILSVLKAGGAYMPIDPEYPIGRIQYMLSDSNSRILLTHNNFQDNIEYNGQIIDISDENIYRRDVKKLENINKSEDLLYVMYTSGSTGNPKGVMLQHKGVVNISKWYKDMFSIEKNKRIIHMANVSFDASIVEIFPFLIYGGTLYIVRKEIALNKKEFINFIDKNNINIAQFVPMTLKELLSDASKPKSLNKVLVAGDCLEDSLKDKILSQGYDLSNHYGPTEGTVDSIATKCEKGITTIGKPIYNTRVYILDKDDKLCPIGASGELCVAGDGLARGYLNKPELTEEKFVENPFSLGEKMYRTGDLACWESDGNITFQGRIDHQVKIRGYRIELEEIETQLLKHNDIKEAVVIDKVDSNGAKYLCAYIVARTKLLIPELKEHISNDLPGYMVPSRFVQMEKMPITTSGKVDRKALPHPENDIDTGTEYVPPTNLIEKKLIKIWQEVLDVKNIGINHNFFELGGHSINATVLVSRIHEELNIEVPFSEIYKSPTIKRLSKYIKKSQEKEYTSIPKLPEMEYYPISSAQNRIYIMWQLDMKSTAYNVPLGLILEGDLNKVKFEEAINKIVKRHEVLRTSFKIVDGEPMQRIHSNIDVNIEYRETEENNIKAIAEQFIKPFDLEKAPLMRVALIKYAHKKHLLLFDMHHIITDGISTNILSKEFTSAYEGRELQDLRIQYKDYASWNNEFIRSQAMMNIRDYWMNKLNDFAKTELPRSTYINNGQVFGKVIQSELDTEIYEKMNDFCIRYGITKSTFMLAIFKIILMKICNQNDITIGVPVAGRKHKDLENIMGVFLNVLLVRTNIDKNDTFGDYLQIVNNNLMEALEYQDLPYEDLFSMAKEEMKLKDTSLFSILFNYLPYQKDQELKLSEINISPYEFREIEPKYSLTLYVTEGVDKISLRATFRSDIEGYMIENILNNFKPVMESVINNENKLINEILSWSTNKTDVYLEEFDVEFDNQEFF
ncbi:non-ribosomal peptide synthetase [Oceanirhabdus sp. W0125-5]|uniref:non-ribosomal peptide synthetase n=1 Tax=Oceanirhabdus sp. W0125-5 TaxID=2999116 RepID=UPI0022F30F95|nr:non-ribosomal peptide synthetase [Oceanirhabdus sp. W0125-5]WBW96388.1 amino acid adenylation domain-containing protein [Oceanirhabdus sp. W0125-5]